jgi:hypothetical protein
VFLLDYILCGGFLKFFCSGIIALVWVIIIVMFCYAVGKAVTGCILASVVDYHVKEQFIFNINIKRNFMWKKILAFHMKEVDLNLI